MEIDDESEKTEAVEENYHINRIKDRILNNTLANRIVRMLYDQWYPGTITWYNEKLDEYCILFFDKSED